MFYLHNRQPSVTECHLSTVSSHSEMENICQQEETTVFDDIQNLVLEDNVETFENTPLQHQESVDSGFAELS